MSLDHVLVSASRSNLTEAVALAVEHGLGVELMAFAYPDILDGRVKDTIAELKPIVKEVRGPLTLHGPFFDMSPGSVDERINTLVRHRYTQGLQAASELGARRMVVHANFLSAIRNDFYRVGWHERNVQFWADFAEIARTYGVTICLENMWEFEPSIIANLLREVNHTALACCLDVGHSFLFSDDEVMLTDWLRTLEPWLIHTHLNNNNGRIDEHHGFNYAKGVLDYRTILPQLRALTPAPLMVLEMDKVADMRDSLPYFLTQPKEKVMRDEG
ncbi:MAG: sugar phosphate isomerase/epimerase [Anaerolineae bacterium]|nr:sugar phosphate isomerase/epimerase [Anaerolineae bacterium]